LALSLQVYDEPSQGWMHLVCRRRDTVRVAPTQLLQPAKRKHCDDDPSKQNI
jgi:hypothetical protein